MIKSNKTVFITGATAGIGKATTKIFAKNGHDLIITGRRKEKLEAIAHKYADKYAVDILPLVFDVTDKKAVDKAVDSIPEKWRDIDVLINNAGLARGNSPLHEGDITMWEEMIDTNVKGLLYITRKLTPSMVKKRNGHIINVCSTAGHQAYPGGNVYVATKFAVGALTKSMAIDFHTHNIKVGQVSPGHVETEFALVRYDWDAEKANIYSDFTPLRAKDIANSIYFMASQPPHVNIQEILVMPTQQANSNFIDRSGKI